MNKWEEAALVAAMGNKVNVPVLSFAAPAITSPILQHRGFVLDELLKLQLTTQSRVVLQSSIPMVSHLFREAKKVGPVGRESAWIISESVASVLDSVNNFVISSMEGALGIKTYYSNSGNSYKDFYGQFTKIFETKYPEEHNHEPGIYALRAYDSIMTISQAIERTISNSISQKMILENILLSNFSSLSGQIHFEAGKLLQTPILRIVNVVKKGYEELDFWTPESGFSKTVEMKSCTEKIVGRTSFQKFVKVDYSENLDNSKFDGWCIEVFNEVRKILPYSLPYKFMYLNGSYEDLVDGVYYKTFDAVVGDLTILANRTKYVEFTQPYAESGLSMVVPIEPGSAWMFFKPLTWKMWLMTGVVLIYTMLIVWFLEHQYSPEFNGPLKNQIGTTLWFTFSTQFFAHTERVYSNLTRVVVVVWLFVVLILTSSYTANLSSILTEKLNLTNIIHVTNKLYAYEEHFRNKSIATAFFELPYEKIFINKYCKGFTTFTQTNRFGGFGFVFPKSSPIKKDFSEAILKLSKDGSLTRLEKKWLIPSSVCSTDKTYNTTDPLSIQSFWGLFLISVATSTICLLLSHYNKIYF
ncbi:hypothetical protein CMV_006425 [Castanea mollissima]|uniref:Ionotropic glutamate receptor C-terminal domain-containing protein n=1 Tax=Castanea mollissima TaxID=60419 RepID=A0A8J4RNF6_9ROSI|nr:hypothetical protein CMV_006425 [Castanea mollissima]